MSSFRDHNGAIGTSVKGLKETVTLFDLCFGKRPLALM